MSESPFDPDTAVIQPRRGRREAAVAPRLLLTFTRADFQEVEALAGAGQNRRYVVDCPYREITWQGQAIGVAGPAPGAPYAVMVLEKLIALGAQTIIALGWAGSLRPEAVIGHLLIPEAAYSEEGTSQHYPGAQTMSRPDPALLQAGRQVLAGLACPWHCGPIWTTDAIYRETKGKVADYGRRGLWAVEMEMSALFNVARYRGVALAGVLVISDELFTLSWRHGLRQPEFHQARRQARLAALDILKAAGSG